MKKVGLIGGMSYESTITYYNEINRKVNERLGGLNSAEILLSSVNFEEIELCQHENRWDDAGEILSCHARVLELGGADFILICTNTMHKVYERVQSSVKIPVVHIADATLKALKEHGVDKVGLLGTIYTMKETFYKDRLSDGGVEVLLPSEDEMKFINEVIFKELCFGKISATSRDKFLNIISNLASQGAKGVILGCTEIGLLVDQNSTDIKLFDTTFIHIDEAVNLAIN
ncbi:aspartate/glutamate racemase family protein [Campylobacter sp. RM12920]|uniref:Aspartate/glutamate racemase family protein n=1 Tax=Campylobacter californiensis TaxID=1032243 RepID=A0ABD4JGE5_9BACT|nr:aspartate/glutamate racemase family protein [Campylobacter sp. RM12919]MBE2987964.1 aspartate/glutamate racemase family protein [Campylobacter sp. RM12920]